MFVYLKSANPVSSGEQYKKGTEPIYTDEIVYCYELLGLTPSATGEEERDKYKELAKQHHPDKGGDRHYFSVITKARNKILHGGK